jgi:2-amino-4-hydroxy-6-hydroxymethyldihydropteridine diphosphokinase
MNKAIISVGSNIKPMKNIFNTQIILAKEQLLLDKSKFIKTKPRGLLNQPDFFNGAFLIETNLDEKQLKNYLLNVEARLGRIRTENKDAPRTIDLDIIVFNEKIVDEDFYKYDFVKNEVLELLPQLNLISGTN